MDLLLSIIRILDSNKGPKTKQRFEAWLEVNLVKRGWKNIPRGSKNRRKTPYDKKKKEDTLQNTK